MVGVRYRNIFSKVKGVSVEVRSKKIPSDVLVIRTDSGRYYFSHINEFEVV